MLHHIVRGPITELNMIVSEDLPKLRYEMSRLLFSALALIEDLERKLLFGLTEQAHSTKI